VGHAHPAVTAAVAEQAGTLMHGMGDVHPPAVKVELLEALVGRYPGGVDARGILLSSGSDAVETALKTAMLSTGRAGLVSFAGGYHGVALGGLDATHRADFREPFEARLPGMSFFARYGDLDDVMRVAERAEATRRPIGAVLVEPVQGRGGERVPPPGFLAALARRCAENGWLLIADEIYTGFGRTGRWFACEHEQVVPDLLCVGKGLSSGMPISACLGRAEVMGAWPISHGEALHTQTFLGHPPGCAAALASMRVIEEEALVARSAQLGERALARLRGGLAGASGVSDLRGLGLMIGIELESGERSAALCAAALAGGVVLLPSGEGGRVVSITPPLTIDEAALDFALDLVIALARCEHPQA
jgi:4-aminobutyrate aminotransferase-like enzyme